MKMFKLDVHPGLAWGIAVSLGLILGGLGFGAAIYGMAQAGAAT